MDWKGIWRSKGTETPENPTPEDLMRLNGYDTGAGRADLEALEGFAANVATRLQIQPDMSILEVGCGCGAWLRHHYRNGVEISGADFSPGHLKVAAQIMPSGKFSAADATLLPYSDEAFDVAVAGSCFLYLPDRHAASAALGELVRVIKNGGRGAVTDLPDLACRAEGETVRRGELGAEEYARLYAGLEHQYFDRQEMISEARRLGVNATASTQNITGYNNSPYRFNLWLEKP